MKTIIGISICLVGALLQGCVGAQAPSSDEADLPPAAPFSPGSEEMGVAGAGETEDVVVIAEVPLRGGGTMRFLNETPFDAEPSISVVSVDSGDQPSAMDLIYQADASPLEVFLAASPGTPFPFELVREHDLRHEARGLAAEPRALAVPTVMSTTVDANSWGGGNGTSQQCTDFAAWSSGFNTWSFAASGVGSGRQQLNITDYPDHTAVIANLSTLDQVWVAACKGYWGSTIIDVQMERWNGSSWVTISGTFNWLTNSANRYRYYAYTPNSASRRVRYDGGLSNEGLNKLLLSGAWAEPSISL